MRAALGQKIGGWVNAVLALVYPEWCQICDGARAGPAEGFVCSGCRSRVRRVQPPWCERCGRPFQGNITSSFVCNHCRETHPSYLFARSAGLAQGTLLEAIHRYKYNRALYIEPFLADLLVESAGETLTTQSWDALVPVPLHPSKERAREFNQAERLARHLAKATGVPMNSRCLRRVASTRTQTKLTREERFENVRGAFELRRGASVAGLRLVVVDDVFTTGATTNACAETLLASGAAAVCVWTVARGA